MAYFGVPLNGRGDIDCVLVGPKAVYAIEVKHHGGIISQEGNDLKQVKMGRGGTLYPGKLYKPIGQLSGCIHHLKEAIKEKDKNARVWIEGILVFTSSDAILEKTSCNKVRVTAVDEICKMFKEPVAHSISRRDRETVLQYLDGLAKQVN